MACGLPVISSSVGGLPELVRHNETGFIAEIGDIDRMAKYALELLTNEKKYKLFSENSRQRAVDKFDKSKVVPLYEAYYEQVLKK
jgi:glycosyltransferase involved in cell wall biosynthesis